MTKRVKHRRRTLKHKRRRVSGGNGKENNPVFILANYVGRKNANPFSSDYSYGDDNRMKYQSMFMVKKLTEIKNIINENNKKRKNSFKEKDNFFYRRIVPNKTEKESLSEIDKNTLINYQNKYEKGETSEGYILKTIDIIIKIFNDIKNGDIKNVNNDKYKERINDEYEYHYEKPEPEISEVEEYGNDMGEKYKPGQKDRTNINFYRAVNYSNYYDVLNTVLEKKPKMTLLDTLLDENIRSKIINPFFNVLKKEKESLIKPKARMHKFYGLLAGVKYLPLQLQIDKQNVNKGKDDVTTANEGKDDATANGNQKTPLVD